MRRLPTNRSKRQTEVIDEVFDWFGKAITPEEKKSAVRIALWIMKRKKGIELNEEEREIEWMVKKNMGAGVGGKKRY